ncbi:carbonic anhydrase [Tricladium varicosporioides]|nr:carbonic anhydrase [Hymenoscyphus varicosporioides]
MPIPAASPKITALLAQNLKYATTIHTPPPLLNQGILKAKAAGKKSTTILACSDPRITPAVFMGLGFGEAAIIRNAGGRASDAIRSILALDSVGSVGTIVVVHHTDCGMSHNTEEGFHASIAQKHPALHASNGSGYFYGAIEDPYKTVVEDVTFLKSFSSLEANMEIVGMVLDTHTGLVKVVA